MPPPASADEFLDLVKRSGVADEPRLAGFTKKLAEPYPDPAKLAGLLVRDGVLTYFQADQILQGKWKRFFIGKYKVLERIGSGGMGQVFLCEHKLMRRRVAIKVLPAAKAAEPAALDRFYREARLVAALDHPNIVRAYDIDQDDNLHFLVMEFVDGTNLQDLVKKHGPLPALRAAHYMYGSAVGLQHAHEMGLIHRDIKPGNILIDRSGVVKILDLGLGRFFHQEDDALTRKYDENILGTADYLAPEQAIDSHTVDIRADIYSLGATFYFLVTGQPPFPEGSVAQKLLWHQTREPATVRSIRPDCPVEIATVIGRMMAKDTAARYQTPAEVIAALAAWVQTPIPPPADVEMPQLSAAAMGQPAPALTSRVLTTPPSANPPSPSSLFATPIVGTRVDPGPSAAATPHLAAAAVSPTAWDDLTADTHADARADTERPPTKRTPPGNRPAIGRKPLIFIAVGVLLLFGVVLGGGTIVYFFAFSSSSTVTLGLGEPRKWYVSKAGSPDPDRTLATLKGAVDRAGPDDVVIVLDDRLDEPPFGLTDTGGAGKKKGIRIEAGNAAKLVTWTPRATVGKPLAALQLIGVENFRLSGFIIDLTGTPVESGIAISNSCPGLVIENVTVRNPNKAGFRFQLADAEAARPVRVTRCRVTGENPYDAGVLMLVRNRHVLIDANRFEGPAQAGLKIDGAAGEIDFRHNRSYNAETGVTLMATPKLAKEANYSLTVNNNTFVKCSRAGLVSELALAEIKPGVVLRQNYFAETPTLAIGAPGSGFKAIDNASDEQAKDGPLPLAAIVVPGPAVGPPNAANDAEFLRPIPGKLDVVGPSKVAVGARE